MSTRLTNGEMARLDESQIRAEWLLNGVAVMDTIDRVQTETNAVLWGQIDTRLEDSETIAFKTLQTQIRNLYELSQMFGDEVKRMALMETARELIPGAKMTQVAEWQKVAANDDNYALAA